MMVRFFTLLLLCLLATSAFSGSLSFVTQDRWVSVKKVIDGDTFTTRQGEKIRLLSINTPETQHDTSPAQPFGRKAKLALQDLIAGQQVRLRFDQDKKDKYKRTLAHVYLRNGLWVNAEMLKQGLAHVYTFVPNIRAAKKLIKVEQQARQSKLGMWKHKRWSVLRPEVLKVDMLGQFRLVQGVVTRMDKSGWKFFMGKLAVSIPKKYRQGFRRWKKVNLGDSILVRGRLRLSKKGQWYLSIHTPSDVDHIN